VLGCHCHGILCGALVEGQEEKGLRRRLRMQSLQEEHRELKRLNKTAGCFFAQLPGFPVDPARLSAS
jgi:hypothetical protein